MPGKSRSLKNGTREVDSDDPAFDWSNVDMEKFQFEITYDPKQMGSKNSKKRKRAFTEPQYQDNPLENCGLEPVRYAVSPQEWDRLSRYRKFTIATETFQVHECVLVKLDPEEEPGDRVKRVKGTFPAESIADRWIAHVLEVRAADEQHVFLRVNWLYRPEDLPEGRQPHHGTAELVPSNFMQIIDAMTVDGSIDVQFWDESDDEKNPISDGLYFRQWYDHTTQKFSPALRTHCRCKKPSNPNVLLVKCGKCNTWLHKQCIEKDAVQRAYKDADLLYPNDDDGDDENATSATSSQKKRRKSKGPRPLTNGHTSTELVFAAEVMSDEDTHYIELTDKREDVAFSERKEIVCLKCHEPVD